MEPLVELPVDDATYTSFAHHPPYVAVALGLPVDAPPFSSRAPPASLRPATVLTAERRLRKQILAAAEEVRVCCGTSCSCSPFSPPARPLW